MKAPFLFSALAFSMFLVGCQKDALPLSDNDSDIFAPPPSERCGCMAPVTSTVKKITDVSASLSWEAMPESMGYRVELTSNGFNAGKAAITDTYTFETTENNISLSNLSPGTRYLYRLTTICRSSESGVSDSGYFKTKESVNGDPPYSQSAAY